MARSNLAAFYRSLSWNEMVGQQESIAILRAMVEKDSVPSTIALLGRSGCGKTSSARVFSRALLCDHPDAKSKPCNICPSCKKHLQDSSVSYKELDSASLNINDLRQLKQDIYYKTTKYKVIVLDEFHAIARSSQSVLLKVLEEAPPGVVFMICTTDPEKVLPTILGRSVQLYFSPIDPTELAKRLEVICKAEGIKYEFNALVQIAQISNGQARDAIFSIEKLNLLDSSLSGITQALVHQVYGDASDKAVLNLLLALRTKPSFKEEFDILIKSVTPYKFVSEVYRVITNLTYIHLHAPHTVPDVTLPLYLNILNSYGEDLYRLIRCLSEEAFSRFYSVESLFIFLLWVQSEIALKQGQEVSPLNSVESLHQANVFNATIQNELQQPAQSIPSQVQRSTPFSTSELFGN